MNTINIDKVIIRFIGDSGDGIQLIGNQISNTSVVFSGNDIYTFVEFPPEIKAPAGSITGVSSFQLTISSKKIYGVEDKIDVLVAMNPAALKVGLPYLKKNGILIIDTDTFNNKNLNRAKIKSNPILDDSLLDYRIVKVPISILTYEGVKDILSSVGKAKRCKNFFVLGLIYWLYDRNLSDTLSWLKIKFKDSTLYLANKKSLIAGYNYGDNLEIFKDQYHISPANLFKPDAKLRKISGNTAFALGAMFTSILNNLQLFSANYPITPATDILHELAKYNSEDIKIVQMEDEIAAVTATIGASYGGALSFTCTSGPGLDLMQEGIGLAVMAELPIVVINVQRSGPSTGIPTRSEQTDLMSSIFGGHGECGRIVLSPNSPSDCFYTIMEGFYLAVKYLVPVIILSDSNLANSSELWEIPSEDDLKKLKYSNISCLNNRLIDINNTENDDLHRKWVIPGRKGFECCIGGLERNEKRNEVSYDPDNHFLMVKSRDKKIKDVVNDIPNTIVIGKRKGDILIITWGSVFTLVNNVYINYFSDIEQDISLISLRYLNPLPSDLFSIILDFKKVIVIEENMGQLAYILRSVYTRKIISIYQVTGKPFSIEKIRTEVLKHI